MYILNIMFILILCKCSCFINLLFFLNKESLRSNDLHLWELLNNYFYRTDKENILSTWKENIYINIITDSEERESYFPKSPEIRSRKIPLKLLKQISDASVCVCVPILVCLYVLYEYNLLNVHLTQRIILLMIFKQQ